MKAIKQWRSKLADIADSAKKIKAQAQDILFTAAILFHFP